MQHPPSVYDLLAAQVPVAVQSLVLALAIVLLLSYYVRRDIARSDDIIPDGRVTLRNFIELLLEGIANLGRDVMGEQWMKYMPLVGTLGAFILISNLMGLVPGLGGPTSELDTNLAWALIAVFVAEGVCIREHGLMGWLKHFVAGPVWIWPLVFPLEFLSHLIRVGSLTVRLTANMFADHTLLAIFLTFPIVQFFVPWTVMGLGLFVAFVQAFIFTFLTMSYIGQALEDAH